MIFAALAGHGVALGRMALVASMLADGRLVALSERGKAPAADYAYWLVVRHGAHNASRQQLVDWLLGEAEASRALVARLAAA